MTVTEAAKRLGISAASVRGLVSKGKLPAHRPTPNRIVLNETDVEDYWISCRTVKATSGAPKRRLVSRTEWL